MRKIISITLTVAMVIASAIPVLASDVVISEDETIVYEDEIAVDDSVDEAVYVEDICEEEISVEEEPQILDEVVEEDNISGFSDAVTVDGYTIVINAAEGVFPAGTSVEVNKASENTEEKIAEEVTKSLEEASVVKTETFNFVFSDSDGNVVEPQNGVVGISVRTPDDFVREATSIKDAYIGIYHVDDMLESFSKVATFTADSLMTDEMIFSAAEFSSYSIIIIQPNEPDSKAPYVKSASLDKQSIKKGEIITLTTKIVDDISGYSNQFSGFKFENEATNDFYWFIPTFECKDEDGNIIEDTYESYPADTSKLSTGTYKLSLIQVCDCAGNIRVYSDTRAHYDGQDTQKIPSSMKDLSFTVKNPNGDFNPKLNSISISSSALKIKRGSSKKISITANATTDEGKIGLISVALENKKTKAQITIDLLKSGSNKYKGSYSVSGVENNAGTFKIKSIRIKSTDGLDKNVKLTKSFKKQFKVTLTGKADASSYLGPKITGIKWDNDNKVKIKNNGQTVIPYTVTIGTIKDKNPVRVQINWYNKKTKQYLWSYACNYERIYNDDYSDYTTKIKSRKTCKGEIVIDDNAAVGNYVIANIVVEEGKLDSKGHISWPNKKIRGYGEGYYIKLTSAMKKMKFTIKK